MWVILPFFIWYHWIASIFEDGSTIAVLHKEEAVMWYKIWRCLAVATTDIAGKLKGWRDILNASDFSLYGHDDWAVMQVISVMCVTCHIREYDQDFECNNLSSSLYLHYKQGFHIALLFTSQLQCWNSERVLYLSYWKGMYKRRKWLLESMQWHMGVPWVIRWCNPKEGN